MSFECMLLYQKSSLFKFCQNGGGMCPLPPAHISLIRKDSWTLTFFIFIQFLHLLLIWLSNKHFLTMMCSQGTRNAVVFPYYSSYYPKEEKKKFYKISIDTLWKNIKKRRFLSIEREENIWPQVLRDRIYPPFFQHYEKNIAYRILKGKLRDLLHVS
jgi:hypothetical protein